MKKHIVTCVKCGRQFDANEGGAYYPESRRYVCKRCVDKQKSEQADREKARKAEERKAEADERERVTGMRQSKAAIAVLCGVSPAEALFMAPGEVFDLWELYLSAHGKNRGEEGV